MNVYFHNVSMDFEFYIPVGTGDITRCFFCGGRLKDWKKLMTHGSDTHGITVTAGLFASVKEKHLLNW